MWRVETDAKPVLKEEILEERQEERQTENVEDEITTLKDNESIVTIEEYTVQRFVEKPDQYVDSFEYPRNGSDPGLILIFNHLTFKTESDRKGSMRDANELIQTFGRLGYNMENKYVFTDFTRRAVLDKLEEISKMDHTERNSFICIFLTHGKKNDQLCVYDGIINAKEIWESISKCETLKNKPKLFIFQACKGENMALLADKDDPYVTDSQDDDSITLTSNNIFTSVLEPDLLIVYSTIEGNYSYRHTMKGSWFIQELCKNFSAFGRRDDVVNLIIRTTKCVASNYFLLDKTKSLHIQKQMPLFISTLRKKFYLTKSKERNFLLGLRQYQDDIINDFNVLKRDLTQL